MNKNVIAKALLTALMLGVSAGRANAQAIDPTKYKKGGTSFETDCTGGPTAGTFDPVFGYKTLDDNYYAACGIASITSGGQLGKQQLHRPASQLIPDTLDGMDGEVALAGAFRTDSGLSFGDVVILLDPPVNELSFDVLSVENTTGLTITLQAEGGASIPVTQPTISNSKTHFSTTSTTPIQRVRIQYTPGGILDGWYVDSLAFNAWLCGDQEPEAGSGEDCDDGNKVQCDGCSNDCKADIVGCLDGTTCIANGTAAAGSFGCAACDVSATPQASGEILPSPAPQGQTCDDGLFCTDAEACDGAGACSGEAHDCSDGLTCTQDVCDEAQNQCSNPLLVGCLIGGSCFANGSLDPANPCQQCAPAGNETDWTPLAENAQCGNPSCLGGVLTPAPLCDANGVCQGQPTQSCDGAICANEQSCTGTCMSDRDCLLNDYCKNGTCVPDQNDGNGCTRDSQCGSGFCVDGVCCNKACDQVCESCNVSGHEGSCKGAEAGTDPEKDCPTAQVCGGASMCVPVDRGNGESCTSDAFCKSGHCADGVCCTEACDRSCEACNVPGKVGICTGAEPGTDPEHDCPNAQLCAAPGLCAPENRANGKSCDQDAVCASGHCVDGVCCNTACGSVCESCNADHLAGTCTPFAAGTDPANECSGDQVCSGVSSCVAYETRGNGLCSAVPGSRASVLAGAALLALLAGLLRRRTLKTARAAR